MQVKKFEAPTLQEALDAVKRELGPEAIILQTKNNKKGFGLMSKPSVEITAAITERALGAKKATERHLPDDLKKSVEKLPAQRQADFIEGYSNILLERTAGNTRDRIEISKSDSRNAPKITSQRYADIDAPTERSASEPKAPVANGYDRTARRSKIVIDEDSFLDTAPVVAQLATPVQASVQANPVGGLSDSVQQELNALKKLVHDLRNASDGSAILDAAFTQPVYQEGFRQLLVHGIDRKSAYALVKQAQFSLSGQNAVTEEVVLDQVAEEMMGNTEVVNLLEGVKRATERSADQAPTTLAFIGPSGSGKTQTVGKLAHLARSTQGLKVGLIALHDGSSMPAHLGIFAQLLQAPYRQVHQADQLATALAEFQGMDLILIDTPGCSHRDRAGIARLEALLRNIPGVRTELVLSSTTRDLELKEAGKAFDLLRPDTVSFTRLDEAVVHGSIYVVAQRLKLPLALFGTGQRFPDDLEVATPERVVALVLDLV